MSTPDASRADLRSLSQQGAKGEGAQLHRAVLTLWLCAFAAVIEGFDIQAIGVAAPRLIKELGLTPGESAWLFTGGMIGQTIGAFLGGRVADLLGHKRALIASLLAFGICSLATALSDSALALFVTRLITGIGLGGALPNVITLASASAPPAQRVRIVTMITSGLPCGAAIAGVVALGMGVGWSWRMLFVAGGAVPIVLAFMIGWLVPQTLRAAEERVSPILAAHDGATVWRALFSGEKAATTLFLWVSCFFIQLTLMLMVNWLPTLMVRVGLTGAQATWTSVCFALSGIVGGVIVGYLQSGRKRPVGVVVTYVAIAVSLAVIALARDSFWIVIGACTLAGVFITGAQLTLFGLAPLYYGRAVRGTGVGAAVAIGRVGSVLGPVFAGALLAGGAAPSTVLIGIAPFVLFGGLAAFALCWRSPARD